MLYQVRTLSREELEHLYIKEANKLQIGIHRKMSYNSLQLLKLHVTEIDRELQRREIRPPTKRMIARF